eukprot:11451620-Alexandrium_andersonii.AAC.1
MQDWKKVVTEATRGRAYDARAEIPATTSHSCRWSGMRSKGSCAGTSAEMFATRAGRGAW